MGNCFKIVLASVVLLLGQSFAAEAQTGRYRLAAGPDVASELVLRADGSFEYFLMAGSLDEQAKGTWTADGKSLHLTTIPKPKPAVFSLRAVAKTTEAPLELHVVGVQGGGIAAVDFRVGFDSGDPVEDYTQNYGWTLSPIEKRVPKWVEFEVAIYQFRSPRFPIDVGKGNVLTYLLTPNDIGTIDFGAMQIDIEPARLVVHRGTGVLNYDATKS
jgi:hypothetical protein